MSGENVGIVFARRALYIACARVYSVLIRNLMALSFWSNA
jgi:hypothetical protein